MRGLGTVINVALLIFGGLCGLLFGKKLNERIKDTLLSVNAVAIMMLAVGGVMQNMLSLSDGKLSTGGTVMMIVSLLRQSYRRNNQYKRSCGQVRRMA